MNNIEELKKTALAATSGPWFGIDEDWSDGENIQITCESREGVIEIAKVEGGGSESGFSDPFKSEQQANAIFIALANPSALLDLIAQLEAAQGSIKELESKVNHYVAAEYAHKHFDQTAEIIKRADSAELELVKVKAELSAANQPWRSFVTNDDISALNRFAECCDDPESGGHDLDKDQVERLVSIGALRKTKRNYHETTDFGDFVISAGFTVEGE
ncbi:hypothetical protein [Yersinia intermedia]|uniref:hypothetical protein n=1 Tax=Yersinia intermedia TaxID=631 RepID=UPI000B421C00|nr:hypothetical protein [Yersinia intermedia]OVZ73696.1 hypothetical protein CBW55_18760 [Yersinia intermedia]